MPVLYLIVFVSLSANKNAELAKDKWIWIQVLLCVLISYFISLLSTELRFIHGLIFQITRYPLGKEAPDINLIRLFESQNPSWWLIDVVWLNPFVIWVAGSVCFGLGLIILWCKVSKGKSEKSV